MRIAIDVMSGDKGLHATIPAALQAQKKWPELELILVGDSEQIQNALKVHKSLDRSKIDIEQANTVIAMNESPIQVLRQKRDSSMHIAIDLVKKGKAAGCVSAGNTGALVAISKIVLRTIKNIERPAICAPVPNQKGWVYALDLGANIDVTANQLYQFALMGVAMVQAVENVATPKVGLMNVGSEEMKGSKVTQEAHALIGANPEINYIGFVEGNDIYTGDVQIIVMSGLEGNIALKTSEGLARYIGSILKTEFNASLYNKMIAILSYPILKKIRKKLSPSEYNGACIIGLNGVVVKSHGDADSLGFLKAIGVTRKLMLNNTPKQIETLL